MIRVNVNIFCKFNSYFRSLILLRIYLLSFIGENRAQYLKELYLSYNVSQRANKSCINIIFLKGRAMVIFESQAPAPFSFDCLHYTNFLCVLHFCLDKYLPQKYYCFIRENLKII